jgi:hypothetical protein
MKLSTILNPTDRAAVLERRGHPSAYGNRRKWRAGVLVLIQKRLGIESRFRRKWMPRATPRDRWYATHHFLRKRRWYYRQLLSGGATRCQAPRQPWETDAYCTNMIAKDTRELEQMCHSFTW